MQKQYPEKQTMDIQSEDMDLKNDKSEESSNNVTALQLR